MTLNPIFAFLIKMVAGALLLLVNIGAALADSDTAINSQLLHKDCRFSGRFTQEDQAKDITTPVVTIGSVFYDCEQGIIWQTEKALVGTQILTLQNINYRLDESNDLKLLDSIPDALRAKLLLSVLGDDVDYINKHFAINDEDLLSLSLTPISSTYKRGLKSMIISKTSDEGGHGVEIKILEKRGGLTRIMIVKERVYESMNQSLSHCRELYFGTDYCNILTDPKSYQ